MGSLITISEVRSCFTPALEVADVSDAELDMKINIVEDYIKSVYFNDGMPTKTQAQYPALLIVMSKIIKKPGLMAKYGSPSSVSIGDFKYSLAIAGKGQHVTAYEVARSWEEMAIEMLRSRGNHWFFKVSND